MKKILTNILFVLLAVMAIASTARGVWVAFHGQYGQRGNSVSRSCDFVARWVIMKTVLHGENPYQLMEGKGHSIFWEKMIKETKISQLSTREYPPVTSVFIVPFLPLSCDYALMVYLRVQFLASAIFLGLIFLMFPKRLSRRIYLFITLAFLASMSFRATLGTGQFSIVSLAFLLLAIYFDEKNQWVESGFFLFFSLIKYHLVLPFIFFFFVMEKKWRPLVTCVSFFLLFHLAFAWITNVPLWRITFDSGFGTTVADVLAKTKWSFDIFSIFNRFRTLFHPGTPNHIIPYLVFFLIFILFIIFWRKMSSKTDAVAKLSLVSVFVLLSVYHGSIDGICFVFLLFWISTFKEFRIYRFVIGAGVLYFFFFWSPLKKALFFSPALFWTQILDIVVFYGMTICVFRLVYLKGMNLGTKPEDRWEKVVIRGGGK